MKLTNLAGHKFPSGVSFRRALVELRALDAAGRALRVVDGLKVDGVDDDCKANNGGNCDGGGRDPRQLMPGEAPI